MVGLGAAGSAESSESTESTQSHDMGVGYAWGNMIGSMIHADGWE